MCWTAYTEALPTGINAGDYTVYMKEGDGEAVTIIVTIAKADVVNITPPVASSPVTTREAAPDDTSEAAPGEDAIEEPAYATGDEPAYEAGEDAIEVVFEQVE